MGWPASGKFDLKAEALRLLQRHWGYEAFHPGQWEAIETLLSGRDVVAILPTGGGKSLIYQLAGLLIGCPVLVVSPLIALMQDQVEALTVRGLRATWLSALLSPAERRFRLNKVAGGAFQVVYVSPERLQQQAFRAIVERLNPGLLAIDEVHCMVEWGHDFRPSYRQLGFLRQLLPATPTVALSATLSRDQAMEAVKLLRLNRPLMVRVPVKRANLSFELWHTESPRKNIVRLSQELSGSGLVYVRRRLTAQFYAQALLEAGVAAASYHARLSAAERETILRDWLCNRLQVVVATEAFGMGIDKPDVRWVIHPDCPSSPEAYWQEVGRAGRDRQPSRCLLLLSRTRVQQARRVLVDPWVSASALWPQLKWVDPSASVWLTPPGRLIAGWLVQSGVWSGAVYCPHRYRLNPLLEFSSWPQHWQHLALHLADAGTELPARELSLILGASRKGLRSLVKAAAREGLCEWTELPAAWRCASPLQPPQSLQAELKLRYETYQQQKIKSWKRVLLFVKGKKEIHQLIDWQEG